MIPFISITSLTIPLPQKDIDTDLIIPAQYLTSTKSGGYGTNLFRRLRDSDPNFPLNQERYRDAKIIVAGDNFGCGSSREHAVWALLEYGIRVIIAPSFADIFTSNSLKNGLVLVKLPDPLTPLQGGKVTVDLARQIVTLSDGSELPFPFDPFRKECILKGYDDLDYLLAHSAEIDAWEKAKINESV